MRLMPLISLMVVLALPGTAFAQEWDEFVSRDDRFAVTFPGQPTITDTTWTSQVGVILPARVYSGVSGAGKYTITAVDYNPMERILVEKSRYCPPGAETCAEPAHRTAPTCRSTTAPSASPAVTIASCAFT